MKMRISFYTLFLALFLCAGNLWGQDVTLSWDPSPSETVAGYNVYYKAGDMSFPFDGIGADQGPSPVDVGDSLTTTLTGLSDGINYYFTVTAYDNSANQSTYSNIVSNEWIPALTVPADGAANEPVPVMFQWQTAPQGYSVTYTLIYGTDRNEVADAILPVGSWAPPAGYHGGGLFALAVLMAGMIAALTTKASSAAKPRLALATAAFLVFLSACSGGGGGSDGTSTPDDSAPDTGAPVAALFSIDKGSSDYHQAFDLEPATTYYWKVVATDTADPNNQYVSQVRSFTTEAF